jgi:hypothetical protein
MNRFLIFVSLTLVGVSAQSNDTTSAQVSEYSGQQNRAIKSLSQDDIDELRRGGGWGLAKTAELNGVPGPAHLLELKNEIPLDAGQIGSLEKLYEKMKSQAIVHGDALISLEKELEIHFQNRTITDDILRISLEAIADSRMTLRYTHLATHLETLKILSEHQIQRYNALRGYSEADPCASIPEGHDADMWRKHNDCD